MKIITSNIYPPIPDRSHDWGAYYDGKEEDGYKGFGATEAEAIRDLVENYETDEEIALYGLAMAVGAWMTVVAHGAGPATETAWKQLKVAYDRVQAL